MYIHLVQPPFNASSAGNNSNNSSSSDNNKQQQQSGSRASSSGTNTSSPNEESKNPETKPTPGSSSSSSSAKASSQSRKRSRSDSRSRSQSPAPSVLARGKGSKRKKSTDDGGSVGGSSGLAKEGGTARSFAGTNSEVSTTADATVDVSANLPVPQDPIIFTFESNSSHAGGVSLPPSHSQKSLTSSSMNISSSTTSTPSSEMVGGGLLHTGSTLDDLCRAAAELERMETTGGSEKGKSLHVARCGDGEVMEDEYGRKRPGNIIIPQTQSPSPAIERERYRLGATPPYTPPPILSPSRSIMHLAPGVTLNPSGPCTPNRILQHWTSWRSTDGRKISDTEETTNFPEPRINVGDDFQAKLPECDGKS